MSLIDTTYFTGPINIPANVIGDVVDNSEIEGFITRYEREILIKLFGYEIYKLIAAYNSNTPENTPQRIRDIIEGKEFELSGREYKWNGLINDEKVSIIAYYVYVMYMRDAQTHTSTTGENEPNYEFASKVHAGQKISYAWSKMSELIGEVPFDITIYTQIYNLNEYYSSLFFFMSNFYSTYPDWLWSEIGTVNNFDL